MSKETLTKLLILFIFVFNLLVRLKDLDKPKTYVFDEQVYINSARSVLNNTPDQNWEYPPLGKTLTAVGMKTFGDNPFGWRIMPCLFNFASVIIAFFLLKDLLIKKGLFLIVGALVLNSDPFFLAASRTAAIDNYLVFFTIASFFFFHKHLQNPDANKILSLTLSAICFGLALSVKWSAAFFIPGLILALFLHSKNLNRLKHAVFFLEVAFYSYFATYLIYLLQGYNLSYLIDNQLKMRLGLSNAQGKSASFLEALDNTFFWYFPRFNFMKEATDQGLNTLWAKPNPFTTLPFLWFLPYLLSQIRVKPRFWLALPLTTYLASFPLLKATPQIHYSLVTLLPITISFFTLVEEALDQGRKHLILVAISLTIILGQIFFLALLSGFFH